MKILLVDDSRTIRMVIGRTLKGLGHEVSEAGNGKEGVAAVKAEPGFGLAMVDWNMPEMNGLEFVQAVRADAASAKLPIMMVTTEAEIANMQKAIDAGANEYIMKPFSADAIKDKIAAMGLG